MSSQADDQLAELLLQSGAGHYTQHLLIDLAGDLVTGTLLSQIIYWFRPDKAGHTKLRVEREGRLWLVKGRGEWWPEIRISTKQFDRSIGILRDRGLVEVKLFHFRRVPTLHIWLDLPAVVQGVKSILPKGESTFYPEGKVHFTQRGKSLHTENTYRDYPAETTYIPQDFTPSPLEAALFDLPYWKPDPEADRLWLAEFSIEWPELTLADVKACRDYHDGHRARHKGVWKNRLRNWMRINREREEKQGDGSGTHKKQSTAAQRRAAVESWGE